VHVSKSLANRARLRSFGVPKNGASREQHGVWAIQVEKRLKFS